MNDRVQVIDGWAVRDLPDGGQIRARLVRDDYPYEPERGDDMWNAGVTLVAQSGDASLDEHDGLSQIMSRVYRHNGTWYVQVCDDPTAPAYRTDERPLGDAESMIRFVSRYLRALWGVQYVALKTHHGYSSSSWCEVWVIAEGIEDGDPGSIADATWKEWSAWARGDVYRVETQTRSLLDAMNGEDWEDDETMGTYYGDDQARDGLAEALGVMELTVPSIMYVGG